MDAACARGGHDVCLSHRGVKDGLPGGRRYPPVRVHQPLVARVCSLVWEPLKTSWSPGKLPEGEYCQNV